MKGAVVPVTKNKTHLSAMLSDGTVVQGQIEIDATNFQKRGLKKIFYEGKVRLNEKKDEIVKSSEKVDFSAELSVFLPQDQQNIIRDFKNNLVNELNRQLSGM